MPQYEYRCNACNREFEYQQKMSDDDLVTCEACGADKLERLISWTAVRSNNWMGAITSAPGTQKHELKGTHPVDLSKEHRFKGHVEPPAAVAKPEAPAAAAEAAEAAEEEDDDETAAPKP